MIKEKVMSLEEIKQEVACGCELIGYVEAGENFVNNRILSNKDVRSMTHIDSNVLAINFRTRFNLDYLRYPDGTTIRVKISKRKQRELTLKMWLCVQNKSKLPELNELMCKWILIAKLLGKINNVNVVFEIKRIQYVNDVFDAGYNKNVRHHVFEYERMKDKLDMSTIIKNVKHALGVKNGDMKYIGKLWEAYNADKVFTGDMKVYADAYAAFYKTNTCVLNPSLYTQDIISNSRVYDDFVSYLYDVYKSYKHPRTYKWITHERGLKNTMDYKMAYKEFLMRIVVDYIKSNTLACEIEKESIDVLIDYDNLLEEHLDKIKTVGARVVVKNGKVKLATYNSNLSLTKFKATILEAIARKLCISCATR